MSQLPQSDTSNNTQLANAFKKDEQSESLESLGFSNTTAIPKTPVDTSTMLSQNRSSDMKKNLKLYLTLGLIAIVAGIGTGYGGYKLQAQTGSGSTATRNQTGIQKVAEGTVSVGDVFGVNDTDTFSDSAQGYLEAGGLDGEGSHRLLRPGGESQTVYLTSSVTDLDPLVGMEVKVYGETFKGQKAGWLMDVGRVEVLKTKGDRPITE